MGRWRPRLRWVAAATAVLVAVAGRTSIGPPAVERFEAVVAGGMTAREVAARAVAAETVFRKAEAAIGRAKQAAGLAPDPAAGAGASPLIGAELTPLVTTLGSLESKRLASHPAWAAVLVRQLAAFGIGPGSFVAAGFSGSFPGLNLAVTTACHALGAELVAVSSVTASTFGANEAGFTWPEIEARLVDAGLISQATLAVTVGGSRDRGAELEPDGLAVAQRLRDRAAASLGAAALAPPSLEAAVAARLALYRSRAAGRPIALYVNTGGTDASLGRSDAVLRIGSGFVRPGRFDSSPSRGVVAHMSEMGVPVLMLLNVRELALRWGVAAGVSQ